jgi:hypothetical protein
MLLIISYNIIFEEIDKISEHTDWIKHRDKDILYIDYKGMIDDELTAATEEVNNFIQSLEKEKNLILVDVRHSDATNKITVDALKENAVIVKPYAKKVAVIGVTKSQEVILTMVNMFSDLGIKPFKDIEEAKDWLIE